MNSLEATIQQLRENAVMQATGRRGWGVTFASTLAGTYPAIDYLQGTDEHSTTRHAVTLNHVNRLIGLIGQVRQAGPTSLREGGPFKTFKGDDAANGMCEFRIGANQGHRILGFLREPRRLVLACGFRKPPQRETPPEQKARAVRILREHETQN